MSISIVILGTFTIFALLGLIVKGFIGMSEKHDEKNKDQTKYIIKPQKSVFYFMIFCFLIILILTIIANFMLNDDSTKNIFNLMFILASLMVGVAITVYIRKIVVDGEKIEYIPVLGKTKTFCFSDIDKIVIKNNYGKNVKEHENYLIYVDNKKIFTLSNSFYYTSLFIKHAEELKIKFVDLRLF